MQALDRSTTSASGPYHYALETNEGYFQAHNIRKGDHVLDPLIAKHGPTGDAVLLALEVGLSLRDRGSFVILFIFNAFDVENEKNK